MLFTVWLNSIICDLIECTDGTYGYNCKECSKNCQERQCDKFTHNGKCTLGCIAGYTGDNCIQGRL